MQDELNKRRRRAFTRGFTYLRFRVYRIFMGLGFGVHRIIGNDEKILTSKSNDPKSITRAHEAMVPRTFPVQALERFSDIICWLAGPQNLSRFARQSL